MMPLVLADVGEEQIIRKVGGNPEMKQHLADMGFVPGCGGEVNGAAIKRKERAAVGFHGGPYHAFAPALSVVKRPAGCYNLFIGDFRRFMEETIADERRKRMIKVVARTLVREECIEAYHALAKEIVAATQADRGMIFYTMNQSAGDKRLHAMIEAWEDMESLQAHMASEHFKRIVPQMAQYAEEGYPPEIYTEVT